MSMDLNSFKVWEPTENLSTQMYFSELRDSLGTLSIFLKNINVPDSTLEIRFSGVLGYNVFQEGARLRFLSQFPAFGLINISVNSTLLQWFNEESEEIFEDWNLKHFMICNSDNIIDIITNQKPEVQWLTIS